MIHLEERQVSGLQSDQVVLCGSPWSIASEMFVYATSTMASTVKLQLGHCQATIQEASRIPSSTADKLFASHRLAVSDAMFLLRLPPLWTRDFGRPQPESTVQLDISFQIRIPLILTSSRSHVSRSKPFFEHQSALYRLLSMSESSVCPSWLPTRSCSGQIFDYSVQPGHGFSHGAVSAGGGHNKACGLFEEHEQC